VYKSITHDWGFDLGQDNHARVALINKGLQGLGLTTWFDTERLTGNIKDQMASGIDNASVIIVCITKRYCEKVAQKQNAEDNCKLEFQYSALRKTSAKMVAVVMEQRMSKSSDWEGAVGFVLGTQLYVDMWGDLNDPHVRQRRHDESSLKPMLRFFTVCCAPHSQYFKSKVAVLYQEVQKRLQPPVHQQVVKADVVTAGTAESVPRPLPVVEPARQIPTSGTRALESLTVAEVALLLPHLNMTKYAEAFRENEVDGETLSNVQAVEDLVEMGLIRVKATILLHKL